MQNDSIYLHPQSLATLHYFYEKGCFTNQPIKTSFYGWIRRVRVGGKGSIIFIDIYDGTWCGPLMCVASEESYLGDNIILDKEALECELTDSASFTTLKLDQLSKAENLSEGCSVVVDGMITLAPETSTQKFEFSIHRLRIIGGVVNHLQYPIGKSSEKQLQTLRQYPFMRVRSQAMQSILRIASKAEFGIHRFMDDADVVKVDPNIITMSDCEGAGETFGISPHIFSNDSNGDAINVGLTVSSQLPLESAITGFKQVYTVQKSFRAEKSDTMKHLAEFLHVEYESAFITLDELMDFTEIMIKNIIRYVHGTCAIDLDFLESKFAPTDVKPTRELLNLLLEYPFVKIKHCDAIDLIHKIVKDKILLPDDNGKLQRVKLTKLPVQGEDIGSEHEKLLVKYFGWHMLSEEDRAERLKQKKEFGAFVFLTHWPIKIKSFYMKQCDDGIECESFDLLAPRVGELIGGSMREYRYDRLIAEVERRKMDVTPIQWYIDLRKTGACHNGGFGLGFSRLACLLSGAPSIRDTVFLPVYYGHCPY